MMRHVFLRPIPRVVGTTRVDVIQEFKIEIDGSVVKCAWFKWFL